jgi:hypothetical protein
MADRKLSSCIVLLALTFLLTSCAPTTRLFDTWKDRQFQGPAFKKVMVVALAKRPDIRQRFEDEFVGQLNARGVSAVTCYSLIPDPKNLAREEVVKAVNKTGAEGVLVMGLRQAGGGKPIRQEVIDPRNPMSFENYLASAEPLSGEASLIKPGEVITITTRLFDAKSEGKLVWFTNSDTIESGKLEQEIATFSKIILDQLRKDKLI